MILTRIVFNLVSFFILGVTGGRRVSRNYSPKNLPVSAKISNFAAEKEQKTCR